MENKLLCKNILFRMNVRTKKNINSLILDFIDISQNV